MRIVRRLAPAVLFIHGLLLWTTSLCAQTFYEAPFSIEFTRTTTEEPTIAGNVVTMTTSSTKISNKEIIKECASLGLIPSVTGWSLVLRYDAELPDDDVTALFLRHSNGSLVDPSAVIKIDSPAGTGTAKFTVGRTSISGSISGKLFMKISLTYQGIQGTCYGTLQISCRASGTPDRMIAIFSAITAKAEGFIEGVDDSLLSATLKTGSFSKK